ncbi:MAG: DNA cytosine methyltransferase [Pseudomonadota bacterium]|nr:DNA cytosine methyltransferase [Pseudomonadota bacterium]MDP1903856.1 DNA cytosine methyltransferase [Pseudomonadota bacterium]MDP2353646.1 DNA cytosine methyltransferase [Pseudomonadota bacterium]
MTFSMINRRPIGIDLFAGAGGMSLGFEQAGFDIAAAVEIDPVHCATHEFNFPHTATICASVVDLSGDDIRRHAGLGINDIDVVFGGAPCQGFSLIGKRVLDDPRNQLVFHFMRLVAELRPKYFVFENVKGLTLGKHAAFLQELITAFGERGYDVLLPYRVLNAADYGVPQDRHRLFLIGARSGLDLPRYPSAARTRVTVADAISDLPDADAFVVLNANDSVRTTWETLSPYARRLRGLDNDPGDYSYRRDFDAGLLTSSLRTKHTELSRSRFLATLPGKTEPISRFRKLPEAGLCNTLRAGTDSARGAFTSPRPIHPTLPRVITVREAARLHSYPDWFRLHSTKWHGFRQIGNSVPPLLARAVAGEIIRALGVLPRRPCGITERGNEGLLKLGMGEAAIRFRVPRNVIAQRLRKKDMNQLDLLEAMHAQG